MDSAQDRITAQAVMSGLHTAVVGRLLHCFDSIDSTNRMARQMAEEGAPDGTVIAAEHQTGGRGRLGRSWKAPPCSGILCSVIVRPALQSEMLFAVTMAASLAVVDALQAVAEIDAGIKWPNDVYAGGKKISGILTEAECTSRAVRYAVVGIGINVNWSLKDRPELAGCATSLSDICGRSLSRVRLLQELLRSLDTRYGLIDDAAGLRRQWLQRCLHLDRPVRVCPPGEQPLEGIARGITEAGHLLLESAGGRMHEIMCGDVSLRW